MIIYLYPLYHSSRSAPILIKYPHKILLERVNFPGTANKDSISGEEHKREQVIWRATPLWRCPGMKT